MKKSLILFSFLFFAFCSFAQSEKTDSIDVAHIEKTNIGELEFVSVYCEVICIEYNLFKADVNALVDFGIADKARNAKGWIYDTDRDKRTSFASPMSVIAYMAKRGWEYKDVMIDKQSSESINDSPVWHIILTKRMPVNYTPEDVVGDIDYRIE